MNQNGKTILASSAELGGLTREFSAVQWALMGKDKQGWKPVAPAEVDHVALALTSARDRYKRVTGGDAPGDKSADYLNAVADVVEGQHKVTQQVLGAAPSTTGPTGTEEAEQQAEAQNGEKQTAAILNIPAQQEQNAADAAANTESTMQVERPLGGTLGEDPTDEEKAEADAATAAATAAQANKPTAGGLITAENYKRPKSTEDARELYRQVQETDAPEDAKFGEMVAEIEATLGVTHK